MIEIHSGSQGINEFKDYDLVCYCFGLEHEAVQYRLVLFLADQAAWLIAGKSNGTDKEGTPIDRLHPSYHGLVDQKKLQQLIFLDRSLLGQLREVEAIAKASL